ncbi:MAG: hypothetical protein AAF862_07310 [Pseudomonadota bacterium]
MNAIVVLCLALLVPATASRAKAAWYLAETENFRVYADASKRTTKKLAATLEDFDWLLRLMTGLKSDPPPDKFDVYLIKDTKQLRRYTGFGRNVGGYYRATPTGTAAFAQRTRRISGAASKHWDLSSQTILFHEYAHHFMLRHFPHAYPTWYIEGFAEYVSTARFEGDEVTVGDYAVGRAATLLHYKWLPLQQVLKPGGMPSDPEDKAVFYAQSWLLTHYLLRNPERQHQLAQYLRSTPTAPTLERDFKAAFGIPISAMNGDLKAYMRGSGAEQISRIKMILKRPDTAATQVAKLSNSANDVLVIAAKLDNGIEGAFYAEALRDVARAKEKHVGDYLAERTWAHANSLFGERAAGREALQSLAEQRPNDVKPLFYLGLSYLLEARENAGNAAKKAALIERSHRTFAAAFQRDNAHYPTLYFYYKAQSAPISQAERQVLEEAAYLAPQVAQIRYDLADLWARQNDPNLRTKAAQLFAILAADPHGGSVAAMAAARAAPIQAASQGLPHQQAHKRGARTTPLR